MRQFIGYGVALILALLNGKLVAGAISGIILTPLMSPFERFSWISKYLVPFIQGIAMGSVAVLTAKWILSWFKLAMGWPMVAIIVTGFGLICGHLARNSEERHFHLSAGVGELLGILMVGYHLF